MLDRLGNGQVERIQRAVVLDAGHRGGAVGVERVPQFVRRALDQVERAGLLAGIRARAHDLERGRAQLVVARVGDGVVGAFRQLRAAVPHGHGCIHAALLKHDVVRALDLRIGDVELGALVDDLKLHVVVVAEVAAGDVAGGHVAEVLAAGLAQVLLAGLHDLALVQRSAVDHPVVDAGRQGLALVHHAVDRRLDVLARVRHRQQAVVLMLGGKIGAQRHGIPRNAIRGIAFLGEADDAAVIGHRRRIRVLLELLGILVPRDLGRLDGERAVGLAGEVHGIGRSGHHHGVLLRVDGALLARVLGRGVAGRVDVRQVLVALIEGERVLAGVDLLASDVLHMHAGCHRLLRRPVEHLRVEGDRAVRQVALVDAVRERAGLAGVRADAHHRGGVRLAVGSRHLDGVLLRNDAEVGILLQLFAVEHDRRLRRCGQAGVLGVRGELHRRGRKVGRRPVHLGVQRRVAAVDLAVGLRPVCAPAVLVGIDVQHGDGVGGVGVVTRDAVLLGGVVGVVRLEVVRGEQHVVVHGAAGRLGVVGVHAVHQAIVVHQARNRHVIVHITAVVAHQRALAHVVDGLHRAGVVAAVHLGRARGVLLLAVHVLREARQVARDAGGEIAAGVRDGTALAGPGAGNDGAQVAAVRDRAIAAAHDARRERLGGAAAQDSGGRVVDAARDLGVGARAAHDARRERVAVHAAGVRAVRHGKRARARGHAVIGALLREVARVRRGGGLRPQAAHDAAHARGMRGIQIAGVRAAVDGAAAVARDAAHVGGLRVHRVAEAVEAVGLGRIDLHRTRVAAVRDRTVRRARSLIDGGIHVARAAHDAADVDSQDGLVLPGGVGRISLVRHARLGHGNRAHVRDAGHVARADAGHAAHVLDGEYDVARLVHRVRNRQRARVGHVGDGALRGTHQHAHVLDGLRVIGLGDGQADRFVDLHVRDARALARRADKADVGGGALCIDLHVDDLMALAVERAVERAAALAAHGQHVLAEEVQIAAQFDGLALERVDGRARLALVGGPVHQVGKRVPLTGRLDDIRRPRGIFVPRVVDGKGVRDGDRRNGDEGNGRSQHGRYRLAREPPPLPRMHSRRAA